MELKSQDTKMIQGLSVLAMICLHLFCKDYDGVFKPVVFISGTPLSFYLAQLSDFCVMGFAFCSGYGHMAQSNKTDYYKKRLQSLVILLVNYWIVLTVFVLVSIIAGNGSNMPGNIGKFVLNFLTLDNSYNGAWWYLFTYIIIVLLSPWLLNFCKKHNSLFVLMISFSIYFVAFYIRFYVDSSNWILGKLGPLGMTLFEYILGIICFKHKFFSKAYSLWTKINEKWRNLLSVFIIGVMLYGRTKIVPNLFVAPITGGCLIILFHFWNKPYWIKEIFLFVGKHSTNIWLVHMFFYSVLFVNFVYLVKYPILIYVFMLTITIVTSGLLQLLQKPIVAKLLKKGAICWNRF